MNFSLFLLLLVSFTLASPSAGSSHRVSTFKNAVQVLKSGINEKRLVKEIESSKCSDVLLRSPDGSTTLLHMAALYDKGAVISALLEKAKRAESPVSITDYPSTCYLQEFNASGFTPLHLAIMMGSSKAFHLLLAAGADPNIPGNVDQKSPLQLAFKFRRSDMIKALLKHPQINLSYTNTVKGRNVWHYAARYCKSRKLLSLLPTDNEELLRQADYKGFIPVHRAAWACNFEAISLLEGPNDRQMIDILLLRKNCPQVIRSECVIN